MESSKSKVLVTGISGYLGSHVCHLFLQDPSFQVRGSVRDKNNEKKIKPLRDAFGENFSRLELVELDLMNSDSISKAAVGCDFIVHTASPFPLAQPKDPQVVIKPAVEGTLAVMRAALESKVKRVLITSSCAAVMVPKPENMKSLYNESDWSDDNGGTPYERSKTLAEKAAWNFLEQLPEDQRFELVIINPSLILGPNLITGDFTSGAIINQIIMGKFPGMPKIMFPLVDVREVALAHYNGIKIPEARNKRFILSAKSLWMRELAELLHAEYGQWYKFKTTEMKYCLIKVAGWFNSSAKEMIPLWDKAFSVDHTQSEQILNIQYRDLKDTLKDMVEAMIKLQIIPDKRKTK